MTTRRLPWVIYGVCVLLVVEGLAWMTWRVLALEAREREARASVEHEQAVRAALWQMDAALAPLLATEARRPFFHYRPFYSPGHEAGGMGDTPDPAQPLAPSPLLLGGPEPPIRLHFEHAGDRWSSPQAPAGAWRDVAAGWIAEPERLAVAESMLAELVQLGPPLVGHARQSPEAAEPPAGMATPLVGAVQAPGEAAEQDSYRDYNARNQTAQLALDPEEQARSSRSLGQVLPSLGAPDGAAPRADVLRVAPATDAVDLLRDFSATATLDVLNGPMTGAVDSVEIGPLRAEWLGRAEQGLVFLRDVRIDETSVIQGFWIDWPDLRATLAARVADVLPGAELAPLTEHPEAPLDRRLAVIPAVLTAPTMLAPAPAPVWTPTRSTLAVTWLAVLSAVVATGVVLRQSETISARRARFVSAVTHELRTPLTTFCLYTQMLAEGLVPEARRSEYIATLREESTRLAAVVEDVLTYARLGRRRAHIAAAADAAEVIERLLPAARERAARAGMTIDWGHPPAPAHARIEPGALERIVSNLLDNACKYAPEGQRIAIDLSAHGGWVEVAVRDFGPGVPAADRDRIFHAFTRARRDAESAAQGLGLGLALARGLAREAGGALTLDPDSSPGARFVLRVPSAN